MRSKDRVLEIIVLLLLSVLILYMSSGVILNSFRTDEHYFMHSAWAISNGFSGPESFYIPGMYPYLMALGMDVFSGNVNFFMFSRILNSVFIVITFIGMYSIIRNTYEVNGQKLLIALLSATFSFCSVIYIVSMRGYELRPEALANIFLMFGFIYIIFSFGCLKNELKLYISIFSLLLAASLSARYVIPCVFIFTLNVFHYCFYNKNYKNTIVIVFIMSLMFLTFILTFVHDINSLISAVHLRSERIEQIPGMTISDKFFITGFRKFELYVDIGVVARWFRATYLSILVTFIIVSIFGAREKSIKYLLIICLITISSYFYFLINVERALFNYAVTFEYILVLMVFIVIVKANLLEGNKLICIIFSLPMVVISCITLPDSIDIIDISRPIITQSSFGKLDNIDLNTLTGTELLVLKSSLGDSLSAYEQMKILEKYCVGVPDKFVFSLNFGHHPICIKDDLSIPYWLGWVSEKDVFNEIKTNGYLLHSDNFNYIYLKTSPLESLN